jgi:hypothetical protein
MREATFYYKLNALEGFLSVFVINDPAPIKNSWFKSQRLQEEVQ